MEFHKHLHGCQDFGNQGKPGKVRELEIGLEIRENLEKSRNFFICPKKFLLCNSLHVIPFMHCLITELQNLTFMPCNP